MLGADWSIKLIHAVEPERITGPSEADGHGDWQSRPEKFAANFEPKAFAIALGLEGSHGGDGCIDQPELDCDKSKQDDDTEKGKPASATCESNDGQHSLHARQVTHCNPKYADDDDCDGE